MNNRITELKLRIKEEDQKLFDLVSTLSDETILNNYAAIIKYLNDLKDESIDYTVEFELDRDELLWNYSPKSDEAHQEILIKEIQSNFLLPLSNKLEYLLSINEIKKAGRKTLITEFKNLAQNWNSPETKKSIWIKGENGVGKSHVSKAFLNYMSSKGNTVAFIFVPDMISRLKNLIKNFDGADVIADIIEKSKTSAILVLDDIAGAAVTPWIRDTFLLPIIEYRTNNNKPIIFTSNTNIKDFGRRIALSNTPQEDKVSAERIQTKIENTTKEIEI